MWAKLHPYNRKPMHKRESTSGQVAKKIKKWHFMEQM
jgi:hypothetical protein